MRKRYIRKDIMLNEIENEKLITDCQRCNLSYGEYFRRLLMNEQIKEKPGREFYEVMKQLSKIGVNLNQIAKKAIEEYLRIRDNFNPKTKTLLVSKYGSKMSSTAIEKIIKKAYKLSGINDENYCVHTLRHTCATLLYRNGTDIRTIQELLGHVQIDTTEIYTHLHDQEVMDAMLDHPLSQYKMANAEAFCA